MNEFRTALSTGSLNSSPVASKEDRRRRDGASLSGLLIPRVERRTTNQRREDRYRGVVDRATLVFRRKKMLVKVCNLSESGVMVEAAIEPRIGEQIRIDFEGFEPLSGIVRWVRDGRIGLDVGDGSISLG